MSLFPNDFLNFNYTTMLHQPWNWLYNFFIDWRQHLILLYSFRLSFYRFLSLGGRNWVGIYDLIFYIRAPGFIRLYSLTCYMIIGWSCGLIDWPGETMRLIYLDRCWYTLRLIWVGTLRLYHHPTLSAPERVDPIRLSLRGQLLTSFDIGNGWLGLVGPGLEKDFKADYWV